MEQNVVIPDSKTLGIIEKTLASYGTPDGPAEAFQLFPNYVEVGETVTAPPLPAQPPRRRPSNYVSGSQNGNWVEQMRRSAPRPAPHAKKPPPKPLPQFVSSPSGKWRTPLVQR